MKRFKQSVFIVISIFVLVFYAIAIFTIFLNHSGVVWRDYISFHTAGYMITQGEGNNLYDIESQRQSQIAASMPYLRTYFLPFRNPPIVATFFAPLGRLPIQISLRVFTIVNLVILFILFYDIRSRFKIKNGTTLGFLILLTIPIAKALYIGQLSIFILVVFYLIYLNYQKNERTSGLLTGLLFIKPQLLLFAPFIFLLSKNKRKFVWGTLVSFSILLGVSFLISGIDWPINYLRFIKLTETRELGSPILGMYTVYSGFYYISSFFKLSSFVPVLLNIFGFGSVLYLFSKSKVQKDLLFSSAIISTVIFSIHAYAHDLSIFIIPTLILLTHTSKSVFITRKLKLYGWILFILPFIPFGYLENLYAYIFLFIGVKLFLFKSNIIDN